jgi:hypothetical protein
VNWPVIVLVACTVTFTCSLIALGLSIVDYVRLRKLMRRLDTQVVLSDTQNFSRFIRPTGPRGAYVD